MITTAVTAIELCLVVLGWILLWKLQFSRQARERNRSPDPLPGWKIAASRFVGAAACVATGWLIGMMLASSALRHWTWLKSDTALLYATSGALSQLGMLAGLGAARFYLRNTHQRADELTAAAAPPALPQPTPHVFGPALATFVITVSVVYPIQWVWEKLLVALKLPAEKQGLIDVFHSSSSVGGIMLLTAIAVLLAPMIEELVFRAGLFRYLRSHVSRVTALLAPAAVFAALHIDPQTLNGLVTFAPLTAFGVVFALAYERTGRLAVVMVAHGFFNLHTIVLLLVERFA